MLESVSIPKTVTSIGVGAFEGCESLGNVQLPNGIECIEARTFSDCMCIESMTLPESVTYIGNGAFRNCWLRKINIPNGVEFIGRCAFEDCKFLKEIIIPETVKKIGDHAFVKTNHMLDWYLDTLDNLENVTIPKRFKEREEELFGRNSDKLNINYI